MSDLHGRNRLKALVDAEMAFEDAAKMLIASAGNGHQLAAEILLAAIRRGQFAGNESAKRLADALSVVIYQR